MRRADLILTAIALADITVVVPCHIAVFFLERAVYLASFFDELRLILQERRNRKSHRREMFWQREIHARLAIHLVLTITTRQHRHHQTLDTKTWLDDMRDKFLVRALDDIFHTLVADALDIAQIKIGTVGNSHQFFFANRKIKLDVNRLFAIVRPIRLWHVKFVDRFTRQAQIVQKFVRTRQQLIKRLLPFVGMNEIFDLHLFELATAKNKVARTDLVTECLSLLRQTKG